MANRRFIDFPIASTSGDTDIILIWQDGANKQTTKATFLSGLPENLEDLNDVAIAGLTNGQILRYDSVTGKWENTDQGNLDLNDLNDVSIVSPSNGQVLVYNSSTSQWENSSAGFVPYTGAVTTVNLGSQQLIAGQTTLTTNGSTDTLTVNHTSGSGKAINVTKGGNGEGLYINKTSGSGNAATIIGTLEATTLKKTGGTSSQFLKADGSVDSTAYGTGTVTSVAALTLGTTGTDLTSTVANGTTTPVITLNVPTASATNRGALSSADWTTFNGKQNALTNPVTGTGASGQVAYFTGTTAISSESNLFWDATNDRLGVGTNVPTSMLTVKANTTTIQQLRLEQDNATDGWGFLANRNTGTLNINRYGVNPTTNAFNILMTSGNVGIGIDTPNEKLQVSGAITSTGTATTPFASSATMDYLSVGTRFISRGTNNSTRGTYRFLSESANGTLSIDSFSIANDGTSTFYSTVTATSFIRVGGTSSQFLKADGSVDSTTYVPTSRTITINGTSQDLSSDRTYNVGTVTSVTATAGTGISISGSPITSSGTLTITNTAPDQVVSLTASTGISVSGTYPNFTITNTSPSSGGTVTSVTASSPLFSSGGTTPNITIQQASGSQSGFLSSTDWTTFNGKQNALTNPITGTGVSGQIAYFNGTTSITSENTLFWDSTNDRLGIGTNIPAHKLVVEGTVPRILAKDVLGAIAQMLAINNSEVAFGSQTNHPIRILINDADVARINTNGNFLIGSPPAADNLARLQVSGTATFSSSVTAAGSFISSMGNNAIIFSSSAATTGYQTMNLANSGAQLVMGINNSTGSFLTGSSAYASFITTGLGSTSLQLGTNNVIRLTINSSGNVIIQNNKIYGSGEYLGAIWDSNGGNTTWTIGDTPVNQTSWNLRVNTSAAKSGGGSWGDSSDGRLKKDIKTIENALDKINKLNPVTFEWINPSEHNNQYNIGGFIAQEIKEIFPQFVNQINAEGKDKDIVGINEKVYGLTLPFKFDAYIVKSIQELYEQIQELKQEIDTLKN